jgi:PAS domain-containing protein
MTPEVPPSTELNDSFYRTVLDTIPIPVFVIDHDVTILDLNASAAGLIGIDKSTAYRRRGGDVLHCLHATDVPDGCGRGPACRECDIRNSVTKCLEGKTIIRKRINLQVMRDATHIDMQVLMTVSPLPDSGERLALLVIEDITEINALQSLIPICMKCKKVRDNQQHWKSMDDYFHEHAGVDFSHGLCPVCIKEVYP